MARTVLIVEGDDTVRLSMAKVLVLTGDVALVAATVDEGMAWLSEESPTHAILTLDLPDGYGTEILKHVRDNSMPVNVAVMADSRDVALLAEARALSPDAILNKPTTWAAVRDWLAA